MSGTKLGSVKAVKTIYSRYGRDFFRKAGKIGGSHSTHGGYWYKKYVLGDIESIRNAGRIGGKISRRGKKNLSDGEHRQLREAIIAESRKEQQEFHESYKGLNAIKADVTNKKTPRVNHAKPAAKRLDEGSALVYDRKRGLVHEQAA